MLPADARALVYGRTISEVIQSPELRDKISGLFGADWMPAAQGRGQVARGAAAFFEKGGPVRMVSIGGKNYVAVTGCMASACPTRRVLLLIGEGASPLLARLDEEISTSRPQTPERNATPAPASKSRGLLEKLRSSPKVAGVPRKVWFSHCGKNFNTTSLR